MFESIDLLRGPAGWLLVVLVANLAIVLVAQALLVVGLGSRFGTDSDSGSGPTSGRRADAGEGGPDDDVAADRVRCSHCQTANAAGYRFCRECLAELPGSGLAGAGRSDPRRRPLS